MTISYGHIATLTKAAKTGKRLPIDDATAETIATLPGFVGNREEAVGYIMHRPTASAERVMVLLSILDGQRVLEVAR